MWNLKPILLIFAVMFLITQSSMICAEQFKAAYSKHNSTACLEPKATGLCRGKYLRYAYDHKSKNCIGFYYSGCGATQNNFLTYEECRRDCMQQLRY